MTYYALYAEKGWFSTMEFLAGGFSMPDLLKRARVYSGNWYIVAFPERMKCLGFRVAQSYIPGEKTA